MNEPRAQQQITQRDGRAHKVVGAHHLRASVALERAEYVILRAVRQAVEEQVDAQQKHAPRHVRVRVDDRLLLLAARVQGEHGHASCHARDDEVLVQRVPLAKERGVQQHHRDQLAGLGEQEGDVVNVAQAGVSEGGGERGGDGDEGEGPDDLLRGEDGRERGLVAGAVGEVEQACRRGEEGLDRVEENGILEDFGLGRGAVGSRRELLLEVCPCQAAVISQ